MYEPRLTYSCARECASTDSCSPLPSQVIFERFRCDWQRALRLGAAKLISEYDDDALNDEDGDGVPDEVEDLGAVLFINNELYTLAWSWYADAVFSGNTARYCHGAV